MGSLDYKDLVAWQKAMDLAAMVYELTRSFPEQETRGLISQMRRASVSIAANLAEGQARNGLGEFRQYVGIARGSLAELETMLLLCKRFGYLNEEQSEKALRLCSHIQKLTYGLKASLSKKVG